MPQQFESESPEVGQIIARRPETDVGIELAGQTVEPLRGGKQPFVTGRNVAETEHAAGPQNAPALFQESTFVWVMQGGLEIEDHIGAGIGQGQVMGVALQETRPRLVSAPFLFGGADALG